MPKSRPASRRTYYRTIALLAALDPLIDALDAIPADARRSPLPAPLRGRGWRQLAQARRTLGLPPVPASLAREMPGELAAGIVSVLARVTTLEPAHRLAIPTAGRETYPRTSRRE